jgi:tetratricopeptide (TPR) repeat protein
VYAFPNADVVIPDIVLGELDKIKTSRADRELRYRSREISRILFGLSENGKLIDGVPFGKNSVMRVMSFDPSKGKPADLFGTKNSDDRILSVVYQINQESNGRPVTIVTNDLNMLLKAQTLGIKVEHPGEEFAYSGVKRALFKVKAQRKTIWTTLGIAAVIALVIFQSNIKSYFGINATQEIQGPPTLVNELKQSQAKMNAIKAQQDTYQGIIKNNPKDVQALVGMGNSYFDMASITENPDDYRKAVDFYRKALDIDPNKPSVRTDMAAAYDFLGATDMAKQELNKVIKDNPEFYQAYFNMGVIIFKTEGNLPSAKTYFEKTVELAPPSSGFATTAKTYLDQINNAQLKTPAQDPAQVKGG